MCHRGGQGFDPPLLHMKSSDKGYVYILQSERNDSYYIGSTDNVERRFTEHQNGIVKSTKNLGPLVLKFSVEYDTLTEARRVEYKLKSYKSRKIIKKIIEERNIRLKVV